MSKYLWKALYFVSVLLVLLAVFTATVSHQRKVHAQTPVAATLQGTGPHTTCTTPATGAYFLCLANDGVWVSNNGGAYFQIVVPANVTAGVTSVTVCNATGASCAPPVTGSVSLNIPKSVTVTAPTATLN